MEQQIVRMIQKLEREGRFGQERDFCQHGGTTVYAHSVRVACASYSLARKLHLKLDYSALIRGALLHDYFLYDWHVKDPSHRLHGFSHPGTALRNARRDYNLTEREANIIKRHMFPLVPIPPKTKEGWVVCLTDKTCALQETGENLWHKHIRRTPKKRAVRMGV